MAGIDFSKVDMNAKEPIYADDDDNLYVYSPTQGTLYHLSPRDYAGKPGHPLPGNVPGIGNLRMLGMFHLVY